MQLIATALPFLLAQRFQVSMQIANCNKLRLALSDKLKTPLNLLSAPPVTLSPSRPLSLTAHCTHSRSIKTCCVSVNGLC